MSVVYFFFFYCLLPTTVSLIYFFIFFTLTILASAHRLGKPFFTCSHHMSRPGTFSSLWYDLRCFHVQDLTDEPKLLSQCQFSLGENPWELEAVCVTRMNKQRAKNCNNGLFRALWQNKKTKRSNISTSIQTTLSIFWSPLGIAAEDPHWWLLSTSINVVVVVVITVATCQRFYVPNKNTAQTTACYPQQVHVLMLIQKWTPHILPCKMCLD